MPGGIAHWFLNTCTYVCHQSSSNILQYFSIISRHCSQVPEIWKNANVTSVFKKGSRTEAANYLPISLTSVPSKLLEHITHSHIMKHLEQHNILTGSRHCVRAQWLTETQLMPTIHFISPDNNETIDVAVLYFSKAI